MTDEYEVTAPPDAGVRWQYSSKMRVTLDPGGVTRVGLNGPAYQALAAHLEDLGGGSITPAEDAGGGLPVTLGEVKKKGLVRLAEDRGHDTTGLSSKELRGLLED